MTKRFTIALIALALFVLVAVMPVSAAYTNTSSYINRSATVYIGEQGLNVTPALMYNTYSSYDGTFGPVAGGADATAGTIGWWASAANLGNTNPTTTVQLAGQSNLFTVSTGSFVGFTGNWYLVNQSTQRAMVPAIFTVADPTLTLKIWDFTQNTDMTGKSVPQGEALGFGIETNMWSALDARYRSPVYNSTATIDTIGGNKVTDGYINILVKDESGTTYVKLWNSNLVSGCVTTAVSIQQQNVSTQPWTWGAQTKPVMTEQNWSTAAMINGQYAYPVGTYTVTAESKLNNMKDNYKNAGADYTGKTVSATQTITLVSDTLKVEANKDSVVRSKPFSITITGKPNTLYHVWVKGTSTMNGGYDNQPPFVNANQDGVAIDPFFPLTAGPTVYVGANIGATSGGYNYQNAGSTTATVWGDVAKGSASEAARNMLGNGSYVNANVTTSVSGTRTVEFLTTNWTKAQKYTIHVEKWDSANQWKSDEVDVKVEKGAVTIVAAGDQSYYLGEEIKFSGTNTETYKTYLFLIGPNLPTNGANIASTNPRANGVTNGDATTFQNVDVQGDNTWSWKWGTANYALDAGSYTIYAVSQPKSKDNLGSAAFGTVSIVIKKPFVSATASQSTVAQGDKVFITGIAEGQPPKGVKIWILGKNYPTAPTDVKTEAVNSDGSFKYEVTRTTTTNMYAGQYFVVVQHPMQNTEFDVIENAVVESPKTVVYNMQLGTVGTGVKVFTLLGAGSLQGSDAAEALVQAINDPNVDDTYTKLQFIVETPKITITPISDKHVGDKFTITATTNLAVDDDVLVQVVSSSFKPTQKSQSGEFSGAGQTIKVKKGESGLNALSYDVDASAFKPDEYLVTMQGVLVTAASDSALFNVLEGAAPTAVPTVVATTAAPVTTVATKVATTVPTPVPTTKSPGYGALIALIGLGAVAFIVVRRH
ncbi:MEMAR_RS02690 family S-layer glycoprotein [uncultured Methanoregula sp.]|uniref:MEMAR_RS02690 family S-layer glycoprotein n=1 Tax=uncultured Methanoregula sp. TaxID=1005933 RepID=UPI002AAB8550|nr:MEMAR_RS02690 family S-layer glycoprotein [uncultured Methanoregula sp.]